MTAEADSYYERIEYASVLDSIVRQYALMLNSELGRCLRDVPDGYVLCVHRGEDLTGFNEAVANTYKIKIELRSHVLPPGVSCFVGGPHEQYCGTAVDAAVRDGAAPVDPTGAEA